MVQWQGEAELRVTIGKEAQRDSAIKAVCAFALHDFPILSLKLGQSFTCSLTSILIGGT